MNDTIKKQPKRIHREVIVTIDGTFGETGVHPAIKIIEDGVAVEKLSLASLQYTGLCLLNAGYSMLSPVNNELVKIEMEASK